MNANANTDAVITTGQDGSDGSTDGEKPPYFMRVLCRNIQARNEFCVLNQCAYGAADIIFDNMWNFIP